LLNVRIFATVFAALAGLAFGSFLNVCLTRWPAGESIVKPRSHCRSCGRTLAWWENIPLVSWIALRGRCRTCGAWIGIRYPLVELAVCVLWAATAWQVLDPQLLDQLIFVHSFPVVIYISVLIGVGDLILYWLLVALAVLDAEHFWLPDWVTLPGICVGFLFVLARETWIGESGSMKYAAERTALFSIASILAAALLILLIRWTYKLLRKREGIGLGDAKLMAMLAAWLGLPGALLSFFIGVVLGALVALVVLALPPKNTRAGKDTAAAPGWSLRRLPLGTFLCIGGIVSALWGQPILAAYLRWAGF
jgi:leader peptidase (prepilin peptidase) / N-methyltransferase